MDRARRPAQIDMISRSAADAAERLVAVEARERARQAGGVAGAGDAGAGLVGRRPFYRFGDAPPPRRAADRVRARCRRTDDHPKTARAPVHRRAGVEPLLGQRPPQTASCQE